MTHFGLLRAYPMDLAVDTVDGQLCLELRLDAPGKGPVPRPGLGVNEAYQAFHLLK